MSPVNVSRHAEYLKAKNLRLFLMLRDATSIASFVGGINLDMKLSLLLRAPRILLMILYVDTEELDSLRKKAIECLI